MELLPFFYDIFKSTDDVKCDTLVLAHCSLLMQPERLADRYLLAHKGRSPILFAPTNSKIQTRNNYIILYLNPLFFKPYFRCYSIGCYMLYILLIFGYLARFEFIGSLYSRPIPTATIIYPSASSCVYMVIKKQILVMNLLLQQRVHLAVGWCEAMIQIDNGV